MTGTTSSIPPRHLAASEPAPAKFKNKPLSEGDQKIGRRRILALAAVGMMLGFSFNTAFADDTLSQSELRQLFPGSFDAVVYGLIEVRIIAQGNGQLIGLYSGKKDTGRWNVSKGQLCIMLNQWTDGKSSCSEVVVSNGWYRGSGVRFKKLFATPPKSSEYRAVEAVVTELSFRRGR